MVAMNRQDFHILYPRLPFAHPRKDETPGYPFSMEGETHDLPHLPPNDIIIFYIVEFGRLLCPNFDKAWTVNEVGEHTGDNDYWVAVQGNVYDVSNFIHGQHSDIPGTASNSADVLDALAGQDLTGYFPPPLVLACPGLVSDPSLSLHPANFTPEFPQAMHVSGALQPAQGTKLDQSNWYITNFLATMEQFKKGPLVWDKGTIWSLANSADSPR